VILDHILKTLFFALFRVEEEKQTKEDGEEKEGEEEEGEEKKKSDVCNSRILAWCC